MDNRGIETDPGWVNRALQDLARQIEALRSERRAGATTVSEGSFVVTDAGGAELFRIGDMQYGDRGLIVRREDGTIAFEVRKQFAGPFIKQAAAISDATSVVLTTDGLFGGLRSPFFDLPFQPYSDTTGTSVTCGPHGSERTTTSGTFETLFVYDGKRQNPLLNIKAAVKHSDLTTSSEVRLVNMANGVPITEFLTGTAWVAAFATGSTSYSTVTSGAVIAAEAAGAMQLMRLGIQARRTAGAGTVTLAVPMTIGG